MRRRIRQAICRIAWAVVAMLATAQGVDAHEARPASLDVHETAPGRYDLLWRTPVLSGMRLPVSLKLPDGVRNVTEPTLRELSDSLVERRLVEAPGGLDGKRIEFVGLQGTITDVLVRVHKLDGTSYSTLIRASHPYVDLAVSQSKWTIAGDYVALGIEHICFGVDHLLFVLGLLLIVKDRWMLVKTVSAFTVAHSITLAVATLGSFAPPVGPLNAAIALSIFFLGPEIVRSWRGETSFTLRHPWVVAFLFGLLHGFGFAGALTSAGLPRKELPLALLNFNIGVELGQVGFVALVLLLERSFRQLQIRWPRWVLALPGYSVGMLGAFWTFQRLAILL